jgi:hypothetical protein
MLAVQPGCGGSDADNGQDWEQVTIQEPTKGVVTTIEETEPGKYAIVKEEIVPSKADSRIVIKRLGGVVDTLTLADAKSLVLPQDTVSAYGSNHYHTHSHGLGNVLWWSAMGYMMGRSLNSPVSPGIYRREDERSGGSGGGGYYGRAYNSGSSAAEELKRTSTPRTVIRPVSGKSGFFNGSSRGRSSGG